MSTMTPLAQLSELLISAMAHHALAMGTRLFTHLVPLVKIHIWNRGASCASIARTPGRSFVHMPIESSLNSERSSTGLPTSSRIFASSSCMAESD